VREVNLCYRLQIRARDCRPRDAKNDARFPSETHRARSDRESASKLRLASSTPESSANEAAHLRTSNVSTLFHTFVYSNFQYRSVTIVELDDLVPRSAKDRISFFTSTVSRPHSVGTRGGDWDLFN